MKEYIKKTLLTGWIGFIVSIGLNVNVFALDATELNVSTSDLYVFASWSPVSNATGYTLYYTFYPYTAGQPINSIDMGTATNFEANLWEGAAFYLAITANDGTNESSYSNVELVIIDLSSPSECDSSNLGLCVTNTECLNAGGHWWGNNTCNVEPEAISAPTLSVSTSGKDVSLSWTPVPGATGYTLRYAPYTTEDDPVYESADMGTSTGYFVTLWNGASYYVAVVAHFSDGSTALSNTENFMIFTGELVFHETGNVLLEIRDEDGTAIITYTGTEVSGQPDGPIQSINVISDAGESTFYFDENGDIERTRHKDADNSSSPISDICNHASGQDYVSWMNEVGNPDMVELQKDIKTLKFWMGAGYKALVDDWYDEDNENDDANDDYYDLLRLFTLLTPMYEKLVVLRSLSEAINESLLNQYNQDCTTPSDDGECTPFTQAKTSWKNYTRYAGVTDWNWSGVTIYLHDDQTVTASSSVSEGSWYSNGSNIEVETVYRNNLGELAWTYNYTGTISSDCTTISGTADRESSSGYIEQFEWRATRLNYWP